MKSEECLEESVMSEGALKRKSYELALRIVRLHRFLVKEQNEFVLSKQILRCGTSIGANVCEADFAESKSDFIHKIAIARKEASETAYWLNPLRDSEILSQTQAESLLKDCAEVERMLTASLKTAKKNR